MQRRSAVQLREFIEYHRSALEAHEVKYNLILGILGASSAPELHLWSLGAPGACAVQGPGHSIVLGALTEEQGHRLAEEIKALNFPGVVGSDDTAIWFAERAIGLGLRF